MSNATISQVGDNIYVNVSILPGPGFFQFPAEYVVSKTLPILTKCSDYYCSIIRFDIPLNDTPIMIMPIVPNQPNPNLTPFIIGIRTGGVDFPQPVIYVPETGAVNPPPVQNQPTQVITPYYFCNTFQQLITSINTALAAAFVASGLAGNAPYFFLNTTTDEIDLVVDIATFAPTATPAVPTPVPVATIFMNTELQVFLSAFEVNFVGIQPNGRDFDFILVRFGLDTTIPPFTAGATQKLFPQEYTTLSLWTSLNKIVLTSNSIPIISEYTPTNNSGISSTLPIITDFTPQIELAGQSRSIAYFVPTTQYRLVDMTSSEQLNTIDLKIYWQDKRQNLYPLFLSQFQEANIKIGFFKKSLYRDGGHLLKK